MNKANTPPKDSKQRTVPSVIATRTDGLKQLLEIWGNKNKGVAWSKLIDRGLKRELAPLAGKRLSHLVED